MYIPTVPLQGAFYSAASGPADRRRIMPAAQLAPSLKNTKTGLPLCLLGGQYPQVFETAILIPHKEDGSAKIFFWPLLSLEMLKDMLGDIPPCDLSTSLPRDCENPFWGLK